jgi:hypothetical protein
LRTIVKGQVSSLDESARIIGTSVSTYKRNISCCFRLSPLFPKSEHYYINSY